MDLTRYLQNLRDDLLTAASVGDENARQAAALLAGALEPAARLAIMNALSDLAAEVTGALQDTTVELRLDGRDVRVAVSRHTDEATASSRPDTDYFTKKTESPRNGSAESSADDASADDLRHAVQDAGGELSRTTVRLFNELKAQAERAASEQGVSLNTYISRAVSESVRSAVPGKGPKGPGPGGHGRRNVTGYIRG